MASPSIVATVDRVTRALNDRLRFDYSSMATLVVPSGHTSEVIHEESFGMYQGENVYLLRSFSIVPGFRFALISLSFGSCSHCDFLEGVVHPNLFDEKSVRDYIAEIAEYVEGITVEWRTADEMRAFIADESVFNRANYWWLNEVGTADEGAFRTRLIEAVDKVEGK